MTVAEVIADCRASLGPLDQVVVANVPVLPFGRPDGLDFGRGCTPGHLGYFYGVPREPDPRGATVLPDVEPVEGEIRIFLQNIRPLTAERVRTVVLHELHHALGYTEEEIRAMGYDLEEGAACSTW